MSITIDDLGNFEDYLYFSSEINIYINQLNKEEKKRFNEKRIKFSVCIARLRIVQIELITEKLEQVSQDLQNGIKNIKGKITSLANFATTLNEFSQLLSVFTGVFSSVFPFP